MRPSLRSLQACLSTIFGNGPVIRQLEHYSRFRPASLTMQQYLDFGRNGTPSSSYKFLRTELLVRMANIMREFDLLPSTLLNMPSSQLIAEWYRQSFEELLEFKDVEPDDDSGPRFNNQIRAILRRHNTVVETMAEALIELRDVNGIDMTIERNIQYFLDRFYLNRISIRMLQNQHLAIFEETKPESSAGVGYIDPRCHVRDIIEDATESARFLSEHHFCIAPPVKLECINTVQPGQDINVALVPLHLYYILFELIKNSMRATIEHHQHEHSALPPIDIKVVLGSDNLSIKVSDRGGGVPHSKMEHLFHYLYSTAPRPRRDGSQSPFAGYGYGLPISRLYARYFLGDLFLFSMEGYGTDACVYLKAVPSEASELLPVYGASSRRIITMGPQVPDWCSQTPKNGKAAATAATSANCEDASRATRVAAIA